MITKLDFWTPVTYSDDRSWENYLLEKVDSYFYLGGVKARVIDKHDLNGAKGTCFVEDKPLYTALKIVSYLLGFPLLALKYVLRKRNPCHVVSGAPYQTQSSRTIHPYPGHLLGEAKSLFNVEATPGRVNLTLQTRDDFNISIRNQNIFKSSAKVIVNAANSHLNGGGGIDGAIHSNGGPSYKKGQLVLRALYDANYTSGHAALIPSGELKEKFKIESVIVVNGPAAKKATHDNRARLYSCYFNSLVLADAKKVESIAFPAISTGIFGYPKDEAAEISLRAIYNFAIQNPNTTVKTISIHFQDDEGPKFYERALNSL